VWKSTLYKNIRGLKSKEVKTMKRLTSEKFDKEKLNVLLFTSPTCPYCNAQKIIIETTIEGNYKDMVFYEVMHSEETDHLFRKYDIMAVPTIIMLFRGEAVGILEGLTVKENLKSIFDNINQRLQKELRKGKGKNAG